jgi:hypothetical protein
MVSYAGIQPFICLNITHHGNLHSPTITGMFGSSNVAFDTSQVGVKHISSTEYRGWYVFHMEEGICGVYMKYIYIWIHMVYIYITDVSRLCGFPWMYVMVFCRKKKKLKIVSGHNQELVRNLTTDSEQNLNLSTPG